jgi:hypothetical protein
MTNKELNHIDELIVKANWASDDAEYEPLERIADYLASIRASSLAIAIMMRDDLEHRKASCTCELCHPWPKRAQP